jgi:hypothetical protein
VRQRRGKGRLASCGKRRLACLFALAPRTATPLHSCPAPQAPPASRRCIAGVRR